MRTILIVALVAVALVASLVWALRPRSTEARERDPLGPLGGVQTFWAPTVDGREIPCVYASVGYGAGLSCDWSRSRSPEAP